MASDRVKSDRLKPLSLSQKERVMAECLKKARLYAPCTSLNPAVGAAVVSLKTSSVVSVEAHEFYGGPHAEVKAIQVAKGLGADLTECELLVTLEPCSTTGKTPPCTDLILREGIRFVSIGSTDPNPQNGGKAVAVLKRGTEEVVTGVLQEECDRLIEDFLYWQQQVEKEIAEPLPFIALKMATSLDSVLIPPDLQTKTITGEKARAYGRYLRGGYGAVLTGIGTVLADDPLLNRRDEADAPTPLKFILDREVRTPPTSRLIERAKEENVVIVGLNRIRGSELSRREGVSFWEMEPYELNSLLRKIGQQGIKSLFVEAGREVLTSFFDELPINRLYHFVAPAVIGSEGRSFVGPIEHGRIKLKRDYIKELGEDLLISYTGVGQCLQA